MLLLLGIIELGVGFLFAFGFAIRRTRPINWGAKYQRIGGLKPTLRFENWIPANDLRE